MKTKLIIGSGSKTKEDYINLDIIKCKGVDVVHDFNKYPFPFEDNQFKEILIPHSIHCSDNLFKFMEEVWRISKPNAEIIITSVNFLSPIHCQDPFTKTRIGFNTFDVFCEDNNELRGLSYNTKAKFKITGKRWIFSEKNYLRWLSFLPNIYPKFYARFLYFYFPCNVLEFKLIKVNLKGGKNNDKSKSRS